MVDHANCSSRVLGNWHARFRGGSGQRCSAPTRQITLVFNAQDYESEVFFDGKHDKIVSILASMTTGIFNRLLPFYLKEKVGDFGHHPMCPGRGLDIGSPAAEEADGGLCCEIRSQAMAFSLPMFDARVFSVPNLVEAANCLVWREQDATRNSVQMAARAYFSHTECHKKNRSALQDMLHSKGINWNDYPAFFKRGSYLKRQTVNRFLTEAELAKVPVDLRNELAFQEITRAVVVEMDMPPYNQIEDRVSTYFGKA
jgi:tRNA(His) guanylyltransferase